MQELRSGNTQTDAPGFRLTVASDAALEIYDYASTRSVSAVWIGAGESPARARRLGQIGHARAIPERWNRSAWPPACGTLRCIVIMQGWESLFQALKTARQLSLVVEL